MIGFIIRFFYARHYWKCADGVVISFKNRNMGGDSPYTAVEVEYIYNNVHFKRFIGISGLEKLFMKQIIKILVNPKNPKIALRNDIIIGFIAPLLGLLFALSAIIYIIKQS